MIEQNILKWLELGDTIQKLDVYNRKYTLFIFRLFYLLSKHANFSQYFNIIVILLSFGQIWELNLAKTKVEGDDFLEIMKYLEKIFLFQKIIINAFFFRIIFSISLLFCIFSILIQICNSILISYNKIYKFLLALNAIINIIIFYYINGPMIQILLFNFLCYKGTHIYLGTKCSMHSITFLSTAAICLIIEVIFIILQIIISLYFNVIGCINGFNANSKINCNYTTIIAINKIIFFFLEFLINFFVPDNKIIISIYLLLFLVSNFIMSFYVYKKVYYYNKIINILNHYGWYYSTWFSLSIFLKNIIYLKDITIFLIFGFILITIMFYFNDKYRNFKLITELNIIEGNTLKDIEIYNELLLSLFKNNNYKNKTLIAGVIKRFEDFLSSNIELNESYHKFINDKHLQKKFSYYNELKILSIISVIYSSNIEKSKDYIDLNLSKCYFLINKCGNPALAIWICTKIKIVNHVQAYYKYVLLEEIKEYLISKIIKNRSILTLKNVQISSVILYNQYVDLFKIKIYDATCSQIEYFDILKNNMTNSKTTENFLKIGDEILSLRKDILNLWEKIILLNPFSNESEKDYVIYLDIILQDNVLKRSEIKKYHTLKAEKFPEKKNQYYSMFNQESSAVLLADGYSYSGKIIYTTPNFPSLFMFTGKEILNTSIDDLLPDIIQTFHRDLIEDSLKYSNLFYIFKNQLNVLLKGKNGLIFNIDLYVRPVPNISYGLIYFIYIQKKEDENFIIILDENYHINGFTEISQGSNFTMNNNYGLSQLINGHHIGAIIPEFLLQMNYDTKTNTFSLIKDNLDIKGYLYPHHLKDFSEKISKILDAIKEKKISDLNNENKFGSFEEFDDFIKELNSQNPKPYSIFFRTECHSFIGGKYKYYRVYVTNDLLSDNEIQDTDQLNPNSISDEINNLKETLFYQSKIKNINDDSSIYGSSNRTLIKNKNPNSPNLIRLKTHLKRQSKILIKKDVDVLNKENNNKEINLNEEDLKNKQNVKQNKTTIDKNQFNLSQPSNQESIFQQTNMESAEFNKLKNEVINKSDSFYIKLIKALISVFMILIIVLIAIDFSYTKKTADSVIEFSSENLYFTHSKICMACVYNSALNLNLVKSNIIQTGNCPNGNCTSFYSDLLKKCYTEVRVQKYNISYFYQDYLDIFKQKLNAELFIYNSTDSDHLHLDIDCFLNLIIGQALKLIANLTNYFDENPEYSYRVEILDVYLKNLLTGSAKFFYSDYEGFYGKEKEYRSDQVSYNPPFRIILSLILFLISSLIIFYLVCRKSNMEIFFLEKLINFSSSNFEDYLKKLEELKKKFRDDSNDEEEKNPDELDNGVDDIEGKNENSKDNNDINIKKNFANNKENPKNKKNKQNKIQQQKLKKKKIMSDYFIKYNIYFGIKLSILFFISSSFFFITLFSTSNMKKNYRVFDSTIEEINLIFYNSFKVFMTFKEQITIFQFTKERAILEFPYDYEISRPKVGNAVINLIKNSKYSNEYINKLELLFSVNACEALTQNKTEYNFCENIFSSILTKGLAQAIVQMGLIITSCIDELNGLRNNTNLTDLYNMKSSYSNYEMFVGYYMLEAFLLTQKAFEVFRNNEKYNIYTIINVIMAIYLIFFIILTIYFIYFTYSYKKIENSFLNFIGILPSKFIIDDESFFKAINKFGQYFF